MPKQHEPCDRSFVPDMALWRRALPQATSALPARRTVAARVKQSCLMYYRATDPKPPTARCVKGTALYNLAKGACRPLWNPLHNVWPLYRQSRERFGSPDTPMTGETSLSPGPHRVGAFAPEHPRQPYADWMRASVTPLDHDRARLEPTQPSVLAAPQRHAFVSFDNARVAGPAHETCMHKRQDRIGKVGERIYLRQIRAAGIARWKQRGQTGELRSDT